MCYFQKLKVDLLENFDRQLQELMDDFVQEIEKIEESQCNGTTTSDSTPYVVIVCFVVLEGGSGNNSHFT